MMIILCRKDIDNDLFGNARTRSEVFWERYDLLLQVRITLESNLIFIISNKIANFKT